MSTHYDLLTEGEKCYWDAYARLREISDSQGFDADQDAERGACRSWLQEKRKTIWRLAQPESEGGDGKGWDANNRSERYETLKDDHLNGSRCQRVTSLPSGHGTDAERSYIGERKTWWQVSSVDDQSLAIKQRCSDWLIDRRKQVWHLLRDDPSGNEANHRQTRYENLCIATRYGSYYDEWCETHDPKTGAANTAKEGSREWVVDHAKSFLGVSESPADSNRGNPEPSGWQKRVMGFDGQPWCACFVTCMAWDAGSEGSSSAGVINCMTMAQNGQGIYRGWTTDPSKVMRGDFAVVGCTSCHIGMVADSENPWHLIEGNTSPGSEGSQYNGGCVAEKTRGKSEIVGWCLVDYP
jgi:hypothetical protein